MYHRHKHTAGFTLVELMLAMSFIAILLISIAMLSIYLTTLYDRGSTMKDINQAGTEIAGDMKRSIAAASDNFPQLRTYSLSPTSGDTVKVLCTGSVTYIINMGLALERTDPANPNNTPNPIKYSDGSVVRLAKLSDTGSLCAQDDGTALGTDWPTAGRRISPTTSARELLSQESSHTLSVWNILFTPRPDASNPELTTVLLTIGTSESSDIDFSGVYPVCNAGNGSEWCGINTFEVVGRSGNGSGL